MRSSRLIIRSLSKRGSVASISGPSSDLGTADDYWPRTRQCPLFGRYSGLPPILLIFLFQDMLSHDRALSQAGLAAWPALPKGLCRVRGLRTGGNEAGGSQRD